MALCASPRHPPRRSVKSRLRWWTAIPVALGLVLVLTGLEIRSAAAGGSTVSIGDGAFSPTTITVTVGSSITWNNDGNDDHDVTPLSGGFAASGTLGSGESFTANMTVAGTYPYECSIHNFRGTVIVTPRSTPAPTARPTPAPTARPTPVPTARPTPAPTARSTPVPTVHPAVGPTTAPSSRVGQPGIPGPLSSQPPPASVAASDQVRPSSEVAVVIGRGNLSTPGSIRDRDPGRDGPPPMGSSLVALMSIIGLVVGFILVLLAGSKRRTVRRNPSVGPPSRSARP